MICRVVKGVGFGVITQVGQVDGQRVLLLKRMEMSEADLKADILRQVSAYLDEREVWIHDVGVELADVQTANIAQYVIRLAVMLPAMPTGFWDRQPKRTSGRLRRVLARAVFPNEYPFSERLREKQSVTAHLPKGILAHRRRKRRQTAT